MVTPERNPFKGPFKWPFKIITDGNGELPTTGVFKTVDGEYFKTVDDEYFDVIDE